MDQNFFRVPFASAGDVLSIPQAPAPDGSVSWTEGWPEDYAKDMDTDAHAKPVEREAMNFMFNAVTVALRQYQTAAFPEFITAADNNGVSFPYAAGTVVRYRAGTDEPFKNYVSLVDNNTATPGQDERKWQEFIFAEASEEETKAGESGTLIISPRRLKKFADDLEEKIEESIKDNVDPFTVPVGGGMLWFHPVAPDGWLEGNGQAFDPVANPKLLAVYPSGHVPDCRGYALRGWDHGAGVDPDGSREVGSYQDDALQNITGTFPADTREANGAGASTTGAFTERRITKGSGSDGSSRGRLYTFDASRVVRTSSETRGKNIACMVIIKTDQAEAETGEPAPTAIVITPSTATVNAGDSIKFSATVLPASVGGNYPVSWAVSDPSLGMIDEDGLYSSVAGKSGRQTVIASISTGLTATASVSQEIYLTSIDIGAIPEELLVDETYEIAVLYSPNNHTENILSTSSDPSVATLTASGMLTVTGEGTATLALTGAGSGVTASVTVTTRAAELPPVYLEIEKNLAEIEEAGEAAQAEARDHIGLGELATRDSLSAEDVGAAPMATDSLPQEQDLDDLTTPGDYFQSVSSYATAENHYPEETAGAVRVVATGVSEGACRQFYWPYNSTKEYRRCGYGEPLVFSEWTEY
ncbi:phage tail protein [Enterobacter sp. WCHEn045836]|uniref:Ig-like domain-containing protein n=1 Tax=Enterobacter sp. WCHEn045836 TaxID=2497434 RepID=UPI000F81A10F|nr:Ig-like domain-containing protein [Enterobacter sp. WCHEn045836]RTP99426.1 phage tail protein [Enterobacter sp. WCHEn045836]